jgi:hypothetical protein
MRLLRQLQSSLRRRGVRGTLKHAYDRVFHPFVPSTKQKDLEWDREFGVETANPLMQSELGVRETLFCHHYEPMDAEHYQESWSSLGIEPEGYTFVDLGSGKGKVLLLAAALPFRRIIGVEFSPLLHEIAERNIARYGGPVRCKPESICMDARDFEFPSDPLVVFLYNPFVDEVLSSVMANLERSLREDPRPAHVMYACPFEASTLGPFWIRSQGLGALILRPALEIPPRQATVSQI